MIPCAHWRDCGVSDGGCCAIEAYQRPSHGTCLGACAKYDGPDRTGMFELLVHGRPLPSAHMPRKAQILVGSQASPPLYAGTAVKKAISAVSGGLVKPCGGCRKREDWLNKKDRAARDKLATIVRAIKERRDG